MSAQWPSAVVTTSQLYVAVNELQNNLSAGINAAVTTVGLNSTTSFPTVGLVLIDNEVIQYTGISGNNLTGCTRAFDGTSAATHSSGATVSFAFCAAHYNNAANEVIAVESYLDTVLGKGTTVTAAEFARLSGVTSAIQTQLNAKAPTAGPTFTGTITTPLTPSRAMVTGASNELAVSAVTATELGYVAGVTSAIQTQINALASHVFQIVSVAVTSSTATSSGTYQVTGLSASITPSSSSHKILLIMSGEWESTSNNSGTSTLAFFRGGSNITAANGFACLQTNIAANSGVREAVSGTFLDSPASTSAQTYDVRVANNNTQTVTFNGNSNTCSLILVEVA